MKHKIGLICLTVTGCLSAIAVPGLAQSPYTNQTPTTQIPTSTSPAVTPGIQSGFRCDTSGENPTTIYQSNQGEPEPWIQWVSDRFSGSGWTPEARCQEVSSRLETYRRDKKLKYVTLGTVNNQSVICVASQDGGQCEGIIYTLKPGQDGIKALNNLFAWRKGEQGLQSNYESVTAIPYIDVGSRLDEATVPANERPASSENVPETHREL